MNARDKYYRSKPYKLISAYITLNERQQADEEENRIFSKRLKGFHIFCAIIFGSFLLDGVLPYKLTPTKVEGVRVLNTEQQTIVTHTGATKTIAVPGLVQVGTRHGSFITSDYSGLEHSMLQANIKHTRIFSVTQGLELTRAGRSITRYFNLYGAFIFWPLLSLILSLMCLFIRRCHGSTTISVISLLNLIPFFVVAYMT